ncbi:MAG: FmdB family zinc ribbon protein [Terriglobales bacterium]
MPLYEYECTRCEYRFERIQKFSDPPVSKCPECGGKVAQLLSPPALQFKGSGWYVTDYARKSSSPAASSGNGKNGDKPASATAGTSKSESTAESKPKAGSKK